MSLGAAPIGSLPLGSGSVVTPPSGDVVTYQWINNTLPAETIGVFDSTGAAPWTFLFVDRTYTPLYAAAMRGYLACGHPELASIVSGNAAGPLIGFATNYTFTSATPTPVPVVAHDSFYVSPQQNIGATTYVVPNSQVTEIIIASGGVVILPGFAKGRDTLVVQAAHKIKTACNAGFVYVSGPAGHVQTANGDIWDMATMAWL